MYKHFRSHSSGFQTYFTQSTSLIANNILFVLLVQGKTNVKDQTKIKI